MSEKYDRKVSITGRTISNLRFIDYVYVVLEKEQEPEILKRQTKIAADDILIFLFLSFKENKA